MTPQPSERSGRPVLNHDINLSCVDPWGRTVAVPTTLGYSKDDPFAVTLTFHSPGVDVEWIVSRNLLLQGMAAEAGEGDVRVCPGADDLGRAVVVLDFCSPDGELVAHADTRDLQAFLARTFEMVPVGSESLHLDIDGLLLELLASAEQPEQPQ